MKAARVQMLLLSPTDPLRSPAYRLGWAVLAASIAVILLALGFEYFGRYDPCPLCLQQRYAYYAAIPALFVALVMVSAQRTGIAALIFLAVALAFLVNAGLGGYHAGVEWKIFPELASCAVGVVDTSRPISEQIMHPIHVPSCGDAAWRFPGGWGLSMAG